MQVVETFYGRVRKKHCDSYQTEIITIEKDKRFIIQVYV